MSGVLNLRSTDPLRVYRANELAELLCIHEQTVWRWSRGGRLPRPVKLGPNVTGWRACDIDKWMTAKAAKAAGK